MMENTSWLLLIISLPSGSTTARMRLWRTIKALGCVPLRDGAYLLPNREGHTEVLTELAGQAGAEGGEAWVVDVLPRHSADAVAFRVLFDRASEYAEFLSQLAQARKALASSNLAEIARTFKRMKKERESLERIDFFPGDASLGASAAWADYADAVRSQLSPGEPTAEKRVIPLLDAHEYQGRTWATRRHLWVDRVASAWLIRRFIDKDATFVWLDSPAHCPDSALGFDFDGATFTHIGEKVTFEVLAASFGLADDAGIRCLGAIVHALDIGGDAPPETPGFEAVLAGARSRIPDDDGFLHEASVVLDSLYIHFTKKQAT